MLFAQVTTINCIIFQKVVISLASTSTMQGWLDWVGWGAITPPPKAAPVPSITLPSTNTATAQNYYCGDDTEEPLSRDLFVDFCTIRRDKRVDRINQFYKLNENLEALKKKIQEKEDEEREKLKLANNKVVPATNIPLDLGFSWLWSNLTYQTAPTSTTSMDLCETCQLVDERHSSYKNMTFRFLILLF